MKIYCLLLDGTYLQFVFSSLRKAKKFVKENLKNSIKVYNLGPFKTHFDLDIVALTLDKKSKLKYLYRYEIYDVCKNGIFNWEIEKEEQK